MNKKIKKLPSSPQKIQQTDNVYEQPIPKALIFSVTTKYGKADFVVALRPQMVFGRSDTTESVDVDLSSFEAFDKGVSRKHLLLTQQGHQIMVQDLNSTNGSRIGDEALKAGVSYELSNNDDLQLGRLKLSVTFSYKSLQSTILPSLSGHDSHSSDETIHDRQSTQKKD